MNYFGDTTISVIIPSEDLDSYTYQLFLKFASIAELEGNYAVKSTLRKIEDYQNPPSVKVKPEVLEDDGEGCIEVSSYETHGIEETKTGQTFHIPKDCIDTFSAVLEQLK